MRLKHWKVLKDICERKLESFVGLHGFMEISLKFSVKNIRTGWVWEWSNYNQTISQNNFIFLYLMCMYNNKFATLKFTTK